MKKVNENKGFTLAELLIVVAVIAVLVAVAIPTFSAQLEKSRQAVDVSNLRGAFAAGRIAEMEGGVDNVKFEANKVNMTVGQSKANVAETDANKTKKYYTSYWYDPDTGKLSLIGTELDNSGNRILSSEYATTRFVKKSQLGKAQGTQVLADTSQLPGEGSSLVVYGAEQLAAIEDYDKDESNNTNGAQVIQSGAIDRGIRVTFYKTMAGPFKLHEVRFVANANEGLAKEGTEDTLLIALKSGVTSYEVEAVNGTGAITAINLNQTITVNGADFDKDKYDVTVAADDSANFNGDDGQPAYADGAISATLKTVASDTAQNKNSGKITVTIFDKTNHSISANCVFTVKRGA